MLTFKQFLSEDFPYIDDEHEQSDEDKEFRAADLRQRVKSLDRARGDTPLKKIGEIGPYEVHHVPTEMVEGGGHIYRQHHAVVKHKGNTVGVVTFSEEEPRPFGKGDLPKHLVSQHPLFQLSHSGRNSAVPALPSRVYQMMAQHLNMPIMSGSRQSRGGQRVWANLARLDRVSAVNARTGETIPHYNPDNPEHVDTAYPPTDRGQQGGHYWYMVHHPKT